MQVSRLEFDVFLNEGRKCKQNSCTQTPAAAVLPSNEDSSRLQLHVLNCLEPGIWTRTSLRAHMFASSSTVGYENISFA